MVTKATRHNLERDRAQPPEDIEIWVSRVGHALRHLDDRSKLNSSPLAQLAYVKRLAREKYNGHILPRGLVLRELLLACADRVLSEVGDELGLSKVCQYLQLLIKGLSCQQISDEMGLSREHVSRVYRRKALELVTEQFLSTVNSHK